MKEHLDPAEFGALVLESTNTLDDLIFVSKVNRPNLSPLPCLEVT